jgi:hypothetical protein
MQFVVGRLALRVMSRERERVGESFLTGRGGDGSVAGSP